MVEQRPQILDRYHQHTLICNSCRRTLSRVQLLQTILVGYFAVTIAGAAVLPDSLYTHWSIPFVVLAITGLAAYTWLKYWLEPKFYCIDYIHVRR